jgi:coenzyme F420 hydrogenase subunit delta
LRKRVVVLGVGNILFGDDGFGPATIQSILRSTNVPSDVCAIDAGMSVMPILFDILASDVGPKRLIVLDVVDLGRRPGELVNLEVEQLPQTPRGLFSLHAFSARSVLQELKEKGVEVIILACQAAKIPSQVEEGLSEPVENAVARATRIVLEIAKR